VLVVGRAGGPEERLVPAAGFDLETVRVRGLDRDAPWKNLALPVLVPLALRSALGIVDRFRPDVVLGMGGYVMAPAVAAARTRHIPYVPPRVLLVTGGTQGARRLNQAVWTALDRLCERFEEVIHVAGAQGAAGIYEVRDSHDRYAGLTFSDDMPALMGRADLVVSRAGVGTIAEATAVGLPMILVPGTFGGGHQEENAAAMVEAGAAIRIPDAELNGESLLHAIEGLDADRLRAMAKASAASGRRDAAQRVLAVLHDVAKK
jgi:UDP-N-acetylglucosamine:LPS N-acetylglucosamine transferase